MFKKSKSDQNAMLELAVLQTKLDAEKREVDRLREDLDKAREQIDRLQMALFSKEAPVAFREMLNDQNALPEDKEEKERRRIEKMVVDNYLNAMERPLFSAENIEEDIGYLLGQAAGQIPSKPLIDENSES